MGDLPTKWLPPRLEPFLNTSRHLRSERRQTGLPHADPSRDSSCYPVRSAANRRDDASVRLKQTQGIHCGGMPPLVVFSWPYGLFFLAVFFWAFAPEFRIFSRRT